MKKIIILTDYKNRFGSKQKTILYRDGMDLKLIDQLFSQRNYNVSVVELSKINIRQLLEEDAIVLYTSSEDRNSLYKSYIEDIVFSLESAGMFVVPAYKFLKAHNNKVFMELLRETNDKIGLNTIQSKCFGTVEELESIAGQLSYPVVIKKASGAMSRGVEKANTPYELVSKAKKISKSFHLQHDLKEILRKIKYRDKYIRESFYRNKFIVQNLVHGLNNDWKVLVYGNKIYVLYRGVRKNDFRASGSGKIEFRETIPDGILDFALNIREYFDIPDVSLDIGYDGENFHLIEFQFVYYGTTTLEKAPHYYIKDDNKWILVREKSNLEETYVTSMIEYINSHNLS